MRAEPIKGSAVVTIEVPGGSVYRVKLNNLVIEFTDDKEEDVLFHETMTFIPPTKVRGIVISGDLEQ